AHCLKYGFTVNHVLGLQMVLHDGSVAELGGPVLDQPGYDLTGVVVGSEGLLGIVTEVTLRILRKAEATRTFFATFPSTTEAGNAVSAIIASGIVPAAIEMMDTLAIVAAKAATGVDWPEVGAALLMDVDGVAAECEHTSANAIELASMGWAQTRRPTCQRCSRRTTWRRCSSCAVRSILWAPSIRARSSLRPGFAATSRGCTGRIQPSCREKRGALEGRVDRRGAGAARAGRPHFALRRRGNGAAAGAAGRSGDLHRETEPGGGVRTGRSGGDRGVRGDPGAAPGGAGEERAAARARSAPARGGDPLEMVRHVHALQLEPVAMIALGEGAGWDVFIRFEGFGAGVRAQREKLRELEEAEWPGHAEGAVRLRFGALPTQAAQVA